MVIKWIKTIWHAIHSQNWSGDETNEIYGKMAGWMNRNERASDWTSERTNNNKNAKMENRKIICIFRQRDGIFVRSNEHDCCRCRKKNRSSRDVRSGSILFFPFLSILRFQMNRNHHEYWRLSEHTIRFIGSIILFILQILRQNQHLFTTNSIKSLAPTHLSLSRKQFTPFSFVSLALLFLSLFLQFYSSFDSFHWNLNWKK